MGEDPSYTNSTSKKQTIQLKMGRGPEYTFFQRRRTHGQQTHKIWAPLIIREICKTNHNEISSRRCQKTPIKKARNTKCWWGRGDKEPLCSAGRSLNWSSHDGNSTEAPQTAKRGKTMWPSKATSGSLPKKTKTRFQTDFWALTFIVVLFTILTIQKQPKCPLILINEWIKKIAWYAMEYSQP